ncbi:LLM class flavin-dependent oxidoreductase [Streptomyces sp. BR1]|uniref:LLM class flavin-dependent oxidoreductase n=1 Tax=Streptomyces sp. BR1 TaxID=1592323 RepID=UPI00402BA2BB
MNTRIQVGVLLPIGHAQWGEGLSDGSCLGRGGLARPSAALSSIADAPRRLNPPPCSCTHQPPAHQHRNRVPDRKRPDPPDRPSGTDPRSLVGFGVRAERLGYDSLWVNDSLIEPRIEALTMLSALTPVTSRVTLGTAALMPVLRRPVQTAQTLASLDLMSGGRLTVTVGAGFPGRLGRPLHDLSEVPWERRFARLDETVALWRQLWTAEGPTSFHGELLRFDDIPRPTPVFRPGGPPVWLGGNTPAARSRTGRLYDGWLPYPPDAADYATGLADVRTAAAGAGRDPQALDPALFVSVLLAETPAEGRRRLEAYSRANYKMELDQLETIQALTAGPPDHVVAYLRKFLDAGARHLVIRIAALDLAAQTEQLERIAELLPELRG